jgi:Beta-lactamase enzyme family
MAPTARPGPSRVGRVLAVFAGMVVFAALAVVGTASSAVDDPAPPAAAGAPTAAATPSETPTADPLAAPATAATSATPTPRPVDRYAQAQSAAQRVTAGVQDWASFTLLDRRTGKQIGDPRSYQTTFTESTIKAWLAADLLATRGGRLTAYETLRMTAMIRLSDDNAAEVIWRWLGSDASIAKMIKVCRLQDTQVYHEWWSKTEISSRDLARLGDCIVPGKGRFLSPAVGAPLMALMRSVDPTNAFGIQQVDPAGAGVRIAVKNGWTMHGASTGTRWNVNCLGIWGPGSRWVLAVTTRYPVGNGLDFGAGVCRQVTRAILPLTRSA